MAADEGQERTEQATPKRKSEARKKGQVPRSRELNTTLMLLAASGVILMFGGYFVDSLSEMFRTGLTIDRAKLANPATLVNALRDALQDGMLAILPFIVVMVVVAIASPLLLSGWTFSTDQVTLKWSRLDPIAGFGRMFAVRGVVELIKALLKFGFILTIAIVLLWTNLDKIIGLGSESLDIAAGHAAKFAGWTFFVLSFSLAIVPLIDVPFQLWDYTRQLRMTRQEIRDEFKQSEGSPEVRARIRQMQREIAKRRMLLAVPKADVIVTNPTHYAVALRYDQTKNRAPVVVAKGMDLIAMQIRNIGDDHHIPVVHAPPLARALYYSTKIDQEIPMGLYLAVAKLLAYVFQLKNWRRDGDSPQMPDFPIPEDLKRDAASNGATP